MASEQTYIAIPTNKGLEKIRKAMWEGGKLELVTLGYGDGGGSYYRPSPTQEALRNQVGTTETQATTIDDAANITWISAVIGAHLPDCTIREVGLYDKDGDLVFIANTPEIDKVDVTEGTLVDVPIEIGIRNYYAEFITIPVSPTNEYASKSWVLQNTMSADASTLFENPEAIENIRSVAYGPIVYTVYKEETIELPMLPLK